MPSFSTLLECQTSRNYDEGPSTLPKLTPASARGAGYLTGENLKVGWVEFSTLS
jgi:hypothetical protein